MNPPETHLPFVPAHHLRIPDGVNVWGQTEFDLLQTLTLRVRLMAIQQIDRIWEDSGQSLSRLVNAGLVERHEIDTHPLLENLLPLTAWVPGQPEPDLEAASQAARTRWNRSSVRTVVFVASRQAAGLFGSDSRGLPPVEHRDHDLVLSEAYAFYRISRPEVAINWVGEDFFPKAGFQIKAPDAFLVDHSGAFRCVIESAGRYSVRQVASFHDYCAANELPYELW